MALFKVHFGKKIYWDERYQTVDNIFEWYHPYPLLRDVITQYIGDAEQPKILVAGCGTSKLSEELFNEGYRRIVSVDSSQQCVDIMRARYNEAMPSTFLFLKMDVLDMDFQDEAFTHCLDKGMLDSVLSGYRSVEQSFKYLSEVYRVLSKNGVFICVSFRDYLNRRQFLERLKWTVKVHKVYRPKFEVEIQSIKEEFISKKTLAEVERAMTVDPSVDEELIYPDDNDMNILKMIKEEEAAEKQRKQAEMSSPKPKTVDCFYVYVCVKEWAEENEANQEGRAEGEEEGFEEAGEEEAAGEEEGLEEMGKKSRSIDSSDGSEQD